MNTTTTFDTTEINGRVDDLKAQMSRVEMKIKEMNDAIIQAPLQGNTLSAELRVMADVLTRAYEKLDILVKECQVDITEASASLATQTNIMEQKLTQ